jgi:3-oxoacyl-[acyl-carrier-protein] synthase III
MDPGWAKTLDGAAALIVTKKDSLDFLQIETRRNGSDPRLIGMGINKSSSAVTDRLTALTALTAHQFAQPNLI